MLKLIFKLIKMTIVLTLCVSLILLYLGSYLIKNGIERYSQNIIGVQLKVESVDWLLVDPLYIGFNHVRFNHETETIKIESIQFKIAPNFNKNSKTFRPLLDFNIDGLQFIYDIAATDSLINKLRNFYTFATPLKFLPGVRFRMHLTDSNLTLSSNQNKKYQLNQTYLDLELDSRDSPLAWNLKFKHKGIPILSRGKIIFANDKSNNNSNNLNVKAGLISVFDIPFYFDFKFNSATLGFSFDSAPAVNNLFAIEPKHLETPVVSWSGKLSSSAKISRTNGNAPIEGFANLKLEQGQLNLNLLHDKLKIAGNAKFAFASETQFTGGKISNSDFNWDLDLSDLDLQLDDLFHKNPKMTLVSSGELNYNNQFKLKLARIKLVNLDCNLNGSYTDSEDFFELNANILPTDLLGFEQFLTPLSKSPLKGKIQLSAVLSGQVTKPESWNFKIEDLKLQQVTGIIEYQSKLLSMNGPFNLNWEGNLVRENQILQNAKSKLKIFANDLEIKYSDLYSKPKGVVLNLNLETENDEQKIKIKNAQIITSAGAIALSGFIPLPPFFDTDLQIQTLKWDLGLMKGFFPSLKPILPNGWLKSQLQFTGPLNAKNWLESRFLTVGLLSFNLPHFELPEKSETQDETKTVSLPAKLFPDSFLLKNAQVHLSMTVDQLKWKKQILSQAQLEGDFQKQQFLGRLTIKNAFTGSLSLEKILIPLFTEDPQMQFELITHSIELAPVIANLLPNYQGLILGHLDSSLRGVSRLPKSPYFTEKLRLEGTFEISEGLLPTLPLVKLVEQKLVENIYVGVSEAKQNAIKKASISRKIAEQKINWQAQFLLENGWVQWTNSKIFDSDNNIFKFIGKMDGNLNLDVKGSLAFFKSPVEGPFYLANKNEENLLSVPITITETLTKPKLKSIEDDIKIMVANTVAFQKNSARKNASEGIGK